MDLLPLYSDISKLGFIHNLWTLNANDVCTGKVKLKRINEARYSFELLSSLSLSIYIYTPIFSGGQHAV